MYPVAIVGNDPSARAAVLAIRQTGWQELTWVDGPANLLHTPAATLSPNITKVLQALANTNKIPAHAPDREQVRFTPSGFLLTELPLGQFVHERYGAPHLNIETAALEGLLAPGFAALPNAPLEELEAHHRVVAVSVPPTASNETPTHQLYWARIDTDAPDKANVTWLGASGAAWQFSTPSRHHTLFCVPVNHVLDPIEWHPSLHASIAGAEPFKTTSLRPSPVRENWHEGRLVFLGGAGFGGSACYREMEWVGLEDAWVLSRMLENYEEAVDEGLREYARFRRARANRLSRAAAVRAEQYFENTRLGRLGRNLNLALSTRFLPEIAMQRIDWLYGHDCIRGFR